MLIINVMSQETAEAASSMLYDRTAIISVVNIPGWPVDFADNDNLVAVLALQFADTSCDGPSSFNTEQAEEIRDFLRDVLSRIDRLIVHCEFGVSRSAGIAAAILKTLCGDESSIFGNPWFVPNMRCFRMTYNALHDSNGNSLIGEMECEFRDSVL